jgi:hypothetical protein
MAQKIAAQKIVTDGETLSSSVCRFNHFPYLVTEVQLLPSF